MNLPETVSVSTEALALVLFSLNGPPHLIRELQATRLPLELFADNPINVLVREYNAAIKAANACAVAQGD